MTLCKFTRTANGSAVYINPAHIVELFDFRGGTWITLSVQGKDDKPYHVVVIEPLDTVVKAVDLHLGG